MEEEHAVSEDQQREEAEEARATGADEALTQADTDAAEGAAGSGVAADGGNSDADAGNEADDDGFDADDEVIELEIDEDDIEYYIVDEDDNEIGFAVLDDDGNPVEYYYDEGEEPLHGSEGDGKGSAKEKRDSEVLFTREEIAQTTSDLNAVYHEGKDTIDELKETYEDIMSGFDFLRKH